DAALLTELDLADWSRHARDRLEAAFSSETAQQGWPTSAPSSGQCAAVAVIVHELLGGRMVSALVDGRSHWFNRLNTSVGDVDLDLTADQFGYPPIRLSRAGKLYPGTRVRQSIEVSLETKARSNLL